MAADAELFASFFVPDPVYIRSDRIEDAAMSADGQWLAYVDGGP